MNSWYDIVGLTEKESENCEGIDVSVSSVSELINKEVASGIRPERIVVGGFSQGGALSIHTGLAWKGAERLGGVLVLSGYLACAKKFALSDAGKKTPVLQCHGDRDPLISMQVAEKTRLALIEKGHVDTYSFKTYKGMAHSACTQEMADVVSFLSEVLPHQVEQKDPTVMSVKELKAALLAKGIDPTKFVEKSELVAELSKNLKQ